MQRTQYTGRPDATRLYVERHMWPTLTSANQANMSYLGGLDTSGRGRVKATYVMIGDARGRSPRTIENQIRGLLLTGLYLVREGWTFLIVGAEKHDERRCGHGACIAAALSQQEADRRAAASDELAALRRKRDAERKRLARSVRKAAEGF